MGNSTKPSEAGERALRLVAKTAEIGAQPVINGSAAKVLVRDGWLTGERGGYSLTVKAKNFLAGVVDLVDTETRAVPASDGYGYVTEYRGTCQHGVTSAWYGSNAEAMDAARDHGDMDDQPYREAVDADHAEALEMTAEADVWADAVMITLPALVAGERDCALLCGAEGPHRPLCREARDLICQADLRTGYCVLPIHEGDRHRDMHGHWHDFAATRRLGDPEPKDPVTGAMSWAVTQWRRDAKPADVYALGNLIRVMDGVNGQAAPYEGKAEQARIFDAGTSYGMFVMARTLVAVIIGGHHGMKAEAYVIDYVRRTTAGEVVAP